MIKVDLELLDFLQAAYAAYIDDYTIYYANDYEKNECSYRELCWLSTTKEEDEPLYLIEYDCYGRITNKTGHTPSDLLIQLANISIDILVDCIECMKVEESYKKVAVA